MTWHERLEKLQSPAGLRIWVPVGFMSGSELHSCGGGSFGQLLDYLKLKPGEFIKMSPEDGSNCQYKEFVEVPNPGVSAANDGLTGLPELLERVEAAMLHFCEDRGYDDPSLIHERAGHPIPRALAALKAFREGE